MKKIIFSLSFLGLFILAGCTTTVADNKPKDNINQDEPDQASVCSYLCSGQIQDLCQEEIKNYEITGQSLDGSIMDEASCQLMCETEWNDTIMDCVSGADTCAQFLDTNPYCMETEDKGEEPVADSVTKLGGCSRACQNYAKCAGYGDDVTETDKQEAYNSCLEICSTWTDTERNCVANTSINDPSDCGPQTACVLSSVRDLMK